MKIKVITNNGNEKFLFFSEFARKSVVAKYNQLVSEGEIQAFEIVGV
jgi:hypothetical protein